MLEFQHLRGFQGLNYSLKFAESLTLDKLKTWYYGTIERKREKEKRKRKKRGSPFPLTPNPLPKKELREKEKREKERGRGKPPKQCKERQRYWIASEAFFISSTCRRRNEIIYPDMIRSL